MGAGPEVEYGVLRRVRGGIVRTVVFGRSGCVDARAAILAECRLLDQSALAGLAGEELLGVAGWTAGVGFRSIFSIARRCLERLSCLPVVFVFRFASALARHGHLFSFGFAQHGSDLLRRKRIIDTLTTIAFIYIAHVHICTLYDTPPVEED